MVRLRHSTSCYGDINAFVADIQPDVERISTVFVKSRSDFLDDCKQTLFVHAVETYNDSSNVLSYPQLINKMWWRAMDFVNRDAGFNFWRVHVPFSDYIPPGSVHPRVAGRYIQNSGVEAKLDVEKVITYASGILSERDFVVFILNIEGLSFAEISKIVHPGNYQDVKSIRRVKSALCRTRKRINLVMG